MRLQNHAGFLYLVAPGNVKKVPPVPKGGAVGSVSVESNLSPKTEDIDGYFGR
jgi:hypothetical protein